MIEKRLVLKGFLLQEHNTRTWPEIESGQLEPDSSLLLNHVAIAPLLSHQMNSPHVGQHFPWGAGMSFSQGTLEKTSHFASFGQVVTPRSHEHALQPMSL